MKFKKYVDKLNVDLTNKTYIVTGANSGLGFETTKYLLYLNATVIMACRNISKAMNAEKEIRAEITTGKIIIEEYDQGNIQSIRNFAQKVIQSYKIDGVVFNAGVYFPKVDAKTKDNFELTVGTNYIGQYVLFDSLKSIIDENTRIVIVTSLTARLSKNHKLENVENMSRNSRYGYSKLLLAKECYELNEKNYKCVLTHPGICSTNILFNKDTGLPSLFSRLGRRFLNIFTHSASKAALTSLLGLVCDYKPNIYIKPRGPFAIFGYPKITKFPRKYSSSNLLEETNQYITQKVGN